MTIKLALASLILGTSTLAAAAPGDYADDCEHDAASQAYTTPGYPAQYPAQYPSQYPAQYEPYQAYQPSPYQHARWDRARWNRPVMLASDVQLERQGRRFITVGPQAGRFARLELKAQQGRTFIKQVYVQFDDGQEQVMRDIDRTVSRRHGLTLDLDGGRRSIRRIVVYGEGMRGGWSPGTLSIIAS